MEFPPDAGPKKYLIDIALERLGIANAHLAVADQRIAEADARIDAANQTIERSNGLIGDTNKKPDVVERVTLEIPGLRQ